MAETISESDCAAFVAGLAEVVALPKGCPERRQRLQAVAETMPPGMARIIVALPDATKAG